MIATTTQGPAPIPIERRVMWKVIVAARKANGLTQAVLAERMKVSLGTYKRFELGRHAVSEDTLIRIADALGLSVVDLIVRYAPREKSST